MNDLNFKGKVALITGVGSGFGAASAKMLAEQGCTIVGVEQNKESLQKVISGLPTSHAKHYSILQDLRDADGAKIIVDQLMKLTDRLDITINSAGVCRFNKLKDISVDEWDEIFEIDVRALFQISVTSAEAMENGGTIINLGSNAGRKGRAVSAHYAAAKAAVSNFSQSLALAYGAKNIRVNTVSPGPIMTDRKSVV